MKPLSLPDFSGERPIGCLAARDLSEVKGVFGSRDYVQFKRVAGLLTPESPALLRDRF